MQNRKEVDLTEPQAREELSSPHFNGYGARRMYGVIANGPSTGQMVAIKSLFHLERYSYSRVFAVQRTGGVPIRKL